MQAIYAGLEPRANAAATALRTPLCGGRVDVAAAAGLVLGAGRLIAGFDLPVWTRVGLLLAGPVVGLLAGLALRRRWHDAGAAVDGHYGLKDRAVTALAFADRPNPTDLQALQMADAAAHLAKVAPEAVVPLKAPRSLAFSLVAAAAAAVVLAWPLPRPQAEAGPAPAPEHIVAIAAEQKEKLAALEKKLAETTQDLEDEKSDEEKKGLKDLLEKLLAKVEELNHPGVDEKEALAKLSEMQTEVQALANQLNIAAMDGQLSSLGTALAASSPFEGAGKALQDGKLEKAAKELEKLDEVKLTPKEAKALEEKLKQLAKQMGDAGQGSLGDAVAELADSLKGGNGKVGKAARTLAKKINNAVKRRKVNDLLLAQIEDLKELARCNCALQRRGAGPFQQEVREPFEQLGPRRQRQRRRREDQARQPPSGAADHRHAWQRGRLGGRDDGHARGPSAGEPRVQGEVPEVPQGVGGRGRRRADPARPPSDGEEVLRADPALQRLINP